MTVAYLTGDGIGGAIGFARANQLGNTQHAAQAPGQLKALFVTELRQILQLPPHSRQVRRPGNCQQFPTGFSALDRYQELSVRRRHLPDDNFNHLLTRTQQIIKRDGRIGHPVKAAFEFGGDIGSHGCQHLGHWPVVADQVNEEGPPQVFIKGHYRYCGESSNGRALLAWPRKRRSYLTFSLLTTTIHANMRQVYQTLAIAILCTHLSFILWVTFGTLFTRGRKLLTGFHIATLLYAIAIEVGPWYCPLTRWEQWALRAARMGAYEGDFITHYLEAVIYPNVPYAVLVPLAVAVCLFNLFVYAWRWRRAKQRPHREEAHGRA